jgi:putative aldouronate transport system substrate-binding protein
MKKLSVSRLFLVLAALTVLVPGMVFGAGNKQDAGVTTLSVFPMWSLGQQAWDETPWFQDYLRENLGIALTFRSPPGGNLEQYMNTQVAANDMADIFSFREPSVITNIVGSGKMLNLNDYKDKLPAIFGSEIYKNAIDFMVESYGGSSRGLYALPIGIGTNGRVDRNTNVRYDIWKKIGAPPVATLEDLLPVLKRMQDIYPVNADGQKVYGLGLWSEWDKVGIAPLTYMVRSLGYDLEYASNSVAIYADGTKTPISIVDENGPYYRVLKWCFQANQMGLLDPDSLTQRYEALQAKDKAGRYLYHPVDWMDTFNNAENNAASIGFAPLVRGDSLGIAYADYPIGESMNVWGIPKNTKNLDAALKFYNWYFSYEGADIMSNGPQGLIWDIGSDGLRYITPKGWDILDKNSTEHGFGDAYGTLAQSGMSGSALNPATNNRQKIGYGSWDSTILYSSRRDQLFQTWAADHPGAVSYDQWFAANGKSVKELAAIRAMPAMPTNIENATNLIADVVKTASWQAIYAANEAEFNAIWKDAQTKANGLGMQDVLAWTTQAWNTAQVSADKYKLPVGLY